MCLPDVGSLLKQMESQLHVYMQARCLNDPTMIGIHTGGAWVAQHLHQALQIAAPLGLLDITFYRDDFTHKGLHPNVQASELPVNLEDRHVILVDDVIQSGRTIRAAMNEIFDYGRPASITLATLISLPGRELPIQPDIIGMAMDLLPHQRVKLAGPEPLSLTLIEID
jgi:pyrimidine operon attenuation protein/uracil phosphoribosyltransferase